MASARKESASKAKKDTYQSALDDHVISMEHSDDIADFNNMGTGQNSKGKLMSP